VLQKKCEHKPEIINKKIEKEFLCPYPKNIEISIHPKKAGER
jgi:hypothetical protein